MGAARRKIVDLRPELPKRVHVGDRVRLKPEKIKEYDAACAAAGYEKFNAYAIRTVTRIDGDLRGGGQRLWVDGAPHMFGSRDVQLAWNTEDERREMLERAGIVRRTENTR